LLLVSADISYQVSGQVANRGECALAVPIIF